MSRRRILSLAVTIPFAMILVALSAASPAARLAPGEMEGVGEQEAETAVIVTGAVDPRTPRLSSPAIGADGRVVAYLEHPDGTGLADLKVTSWDGTAWSLPTTLLSLPAGRAGRPVMSAEGATVAIAEERGAGRYAIWIVDRQGEVWAPAEELRARVSGPALSLDRTGRLLALTEEVSGQPQVVVRRREGLVWSERELVSDPRQGPAQHPSLTPGGTALAFVQRDRVMTARADDEGWIVSEWRETAEAGSQLAWPILAADGSTAFFWRLALRDGKPVKQLFAASRDGSASAPRRIGAPSASGEPGDGPAAVDAAGTTVVRAHDGSLAIARFEAGRWVSTSLPASLGVVGSPVMTADGTRVVWAGRDPQTPTASAVLAASSSKKPAISLPAPRLDFGSTNLDTAVTRSFSIRNTGRAKLKVSRLAFDGGSGGPFVLGKVKLPATIKPGKSLSVPATFTPRELGEWTALVWISSNDPVSPVVGQVLAGTGFWPAPELTAISPSEGPEGTSATLTGSGFGTDASRVTVTVWGGYHYDAAIRSVSGSSIAVTMPTGYCAWRGYQDANVWVTVRGMQSNGRYFRLTNLLPCEPSIVMMEPDAGSVGDVITLQAYGLPAELDRILVSFNGTIVHPDSIRPDWDPELAYITVRVPVGATSGPVRLKRTDGVDRWSQPAEFTVVEPVILGLTAGAEAAGIVVPVVYYDIGLPSESAREVGPAPWRLGGAGFSRIRASLDHPAGTLNLEVTTPNGVATTELTAIGDDAGIVNRPPWVLFKGMKPGAAFTVRAWGYELPGGTIRSSAPLPLTVGRVLYPGTATAINSAFEFPVREGKLAMAQGDTLVVSGIFRDESVSAPGLWDGAVTLNAYGHPFALQAGQLYSKVVQLDQPGSFTIANQTTGQSIQVEVLAAGNNSEYYFDNNRGFAFGEALAREGVTLGCGGARLTIPPGALPPYATGPEQTSEYYDVSCAHVPETRPFADDTLGDAGHSLAISIQPEPPELLQPITIEMPYTMEGRFSRPEMGVYDPATQLYFKLTAAEDDGAGRIRLTLPARKYPMDGGRFRMRR
ncbi:MAG: choice-of-anchor D domain-containing protein [Acidobacteria bacterium]|nr:choice-of-anchor D domain-containing protein [Acidobacteriota bacterium]